jgi:phosphoserine phosphatase
MVAAISTAWQEPASTDFTPAVTSHVVTVTGYQIPIEAFAAVLHRLSAVCTVVRGARTMATYPCTVIELGVQLARPFGNAEVALRDVLGELARHYGLDIALLRTGRRYGLVVFDVDNTLIRGEAIDRLAARAGRRDEVATLTAKAMHGGLDFAEALRSRVRTLAGLPATVLDEVASEVELMPGALVAVRALQGLGLRVGAASGGFGPIVARLARTLRLDFHIANELEVADGRLTGRLAGTIVDGPVKAAALRRFAARQRIALGSCVAVGDGANDIEMLRLAGLGIAFSARPAVVAAADVAISYPRLDLVLPMLGIPVPCALVED